MTSICFGSVPACALPVAFDRRDHREVEVGVRRGVTGHLAQVARTRLGERPRLVEAAEHGKQRRPREILGARGPPGDELVHDPHRFTGWPRADDQRMLQLRRQTVSSRRGAGSAALGATLRRRRRSAVEVRGGGEQLPEQRKPAWITPLFLEGERGPAKGDHLVGRVGLAREPHADRGTWLARASPRSGHRRPRHVR